MKPETLTAERLRELLHYEPETGVFTWRVSLSNRTPVGTAAGRIDDCGYVRISIGGTIHRAHRLAVLHQSGDWPVALVDHRNGKRSDNRWENLREATRALNNQNQREPQRGNSSGYLGVSRRKDRASFCAQITVYGKTRNLGYRDTPEAAHALYVEAKRRLHEGCTL